MIKRYNEFLSGKLNEDLDVDMGSMEMPIVEEPIKDTEPEIEEDPIIELPEEEGDEYQGQILLNKLANELGTEVDASGLINYKGKKINFYSETENFHVDRKKFPTVEEVVAYLRSNELPKSTNKISVNSSHKSEEEPSFDETEGDLNPDSEDKIGAFESKSYRHTRLKKFGK